MIPEGLSAGGLWVEGAELWWGHPRARRRMIIAPQGVVLVGQGAHDLLEWDQGFTGELATPASWMAKGSYGGNWERAKVTVVRGPERGWRGGWTWPMPARLMHSVRWTAVMEVPALLAYLCATEEARPNLQQRDRLIRLLHELRNSRWRSPWLDFAGTNALFGRKGRIDRAVDRVLDRVWPRRWQGRPFAGEWVPTPEELFHPVRRALTAQDRARISDDLIEARIARALEARPWPFSTLAP